MTQQSNRPAHTIRLGNIKATIWPNERDSKIRYSVSLSRGYKDRGTWKDTQSFNHDDLPRVTKCCNLAYQWISQASGNVTANSQNEQPAGEY